MRTIIINDYISNCKEARELIHSFDRNLYIVKGSTGIGGTTVALDITDKLVVVVSPLTGMIKSKESKRKNHQMFLYKGSVDRMIDVRDRVKNRKPFVLNTTPDQMVRMKDKWPDLYEILKRTAYFFVDEFDHISTADYRDAFQFFLKMLFEEVEKPFILSSATPSFQMLDVPDDVKKEMEFVTIRRSEERTMNATIQHPNNITKYVSSQLQEDRKVVVYTNDTAIIKVLEEQFSDQCQRLLGDTLQFKSAKTRRFEHDELINASMAHINMDKNVYILSTKYLIGYDIDVDCSVCIVADGKSDVDAKSYQEIRQAYGRVRGNVFDCAIMYRDKYDNKTGQEMQIDALSGVKTAKIEDVNKKISDLHFAITYTRAGLYSALKLYGFSLTGVAESKKVYASKGGFNADYRELYGQHIAVTEDLLEDVLNSIMGDRLHGSGASAGVMGAFCIAYVARLTGAAALVPGKTKLQYVRLLDAAKAFVDGMDDPRAKDYRWHSKRMVPIRMVIKQESYDIANSLLKSNLADGKLFTRVVCAINYLWAIQNAKRFIDYGTMKLLKAREELGIGMAKIVKNQFEKVSGMPYEHLSADDLQKYATFAINKTAFRHVKESWMNKYPGNETRMNELWNKTMDDLTRDIGENAKSAMYALEMTVVRMFEMHKTYLKFLLHHEVANLKQVGKGWNNFSCNFKDGREYNPAVKCMRELRFQTPYVMTHCDIKGAWPTYIDQLLGVDITQNIYETMAKVHGIERSAAKVKFNKMVNTHYARPLIVRSALCSYGYTDSHIEILLSLILSSKGSFFRAAAEWEFKQINTFKTNNRLHDLPVIRIHDAILIPGTWECHNIIIPALGRPTIFEVETK